MVKMVTKRGYIVNVSKEEVRKNSEKYKACAKNDAKLGYPKK